MTGRETSASLARIRFEATEEALYVANSGRAFDQPGVISICRQNLSAKGTSARDISLLSCADAELVPAIQAMQLELYRIDPNLLLEDRNAEDEATRDYAGRCLLELLQNADDAMAPPGSPLAELIGAKGLGFKSVLELCDNPQIFSGPFCFQFDVARSRALLANHPHADRVGVFRLPHLLDPDALATQLLREGFTTVVRLPFRNEAARALALAELRALEPHFLLLAQHLEAVEIRLEKADRRDLVRSGPRGGLAGAPATLRIRAGKEAWRESQWRVWRDVWPPEGDRSKRLSVAIALELEGGVPVPTAEQLPLFVFYPTEDRVAARFLIHGAFDVQGNRKHVRHGDNDAALFDRMAGLVSRIALDIPAEATLAVFRDIIDAAPSRKHKSVDRQLQFRIFGALRDTAFVPVVGRARDKAFPRDARISAPGFAALLSLHKRAVAEASIARPELEPGFDVLGKLGSTRLAQQEYAGLLQHARCRSIDSCIAAAGVMLRTCLAGYVAPATLACLRAAPVWPTANGTVRALNDGTPLLLERPVDWPEWSPAEALEPAFVAAVFPGKAIGKDWLPLVEDELHRTPETYLSACIAPTIESWADADWERHGWQALDRIAAWASFGEFGAMKPYAPAARGTTARDMLAKVARVPTPRGWVPARHSYARTELGAPACFGRFFKEVSGRHLCSFPSEARQRFPRETWRALLRYLGVSWEPKIWKFNEDTGAELAAPDEREFWRGQTETLRHRGHDWYLEAFPDCLVDEVPASALMTMVEDVSRSAESLEGAYFKQKNSTTSHPPKPFKSFIQFQLRRTAFLPVRSNIYGTTRAVGSKAYWPKRGIPGITPNLDLLGIKEPRRVQLRASVGKVLEIRSELPNVWDEWMEWNKALVTAAREHRMPGGERTARAFYEALLDTKFLQRGVPPDTLVCVSTANESGLEAVPRAQAAWIDQPALAAPEILVALAQAGLRYLPPLLGRGSAAPERLMTPRASALVGITADYTEADRSTHRFERLLRSRWRAIVVQCDAMLVRPPAAIPKIRAVNGLRLSISLGDTPVTQITASNFLDGDVWLIDLVNPIDALANALAEGLGRSADLRYRFAGILKARNRDEVMRALREDGIPHYQLAAVRLEDDPESEEDGPDAAAAAATKAGEVEDGGAELPAQHPPPPPPPPPAPPSPGQAADQARRFGASYYASGTLSSRPLYDPESTCNGGGDGGRGSGNPWPQRQQEFGADGETWLAARIAATMPLGTTVERNVRDELNGESDILINRPDGAWHVEVKTLGTERLYWSDLERGKAERNRARYAMCLLVPFAYTYQLYWSWDPLRDLLPCERRMQYQWAAEHTGPRLAADSWSPVDGVPVPERLPDRATAVIRIQAVHLATLEIDDFTLDAFWAHLASAN